MSVCARAYARMDATNVKSVERPKMTSHAASSTTTSMTLINDSRSAFKWPHRRTVATKATKWAALTEALSRPTACHLPNAVLVRKLSM